MSLSDQVTKAIVTHIWGKDADVAALSTATTAIDYLDGGVNDLIVTYAPLVSITTIYDTSAAANITSTAYDFYTSTGCIFRKNGNDFGVRGNRKRYTVTYTYGYSAIPDDIQLAIDTWVNLLTADNTGASTGYKTGDDSETYSPSLLINGMPSVVARILDPYRRMRL